MAQHQEESCVPPGFRFHPTEEELVGYYLARKVASQKIDLDIIQEVDLYRIEPWDLQGMQKFISGFNMVIDQIYVSFSRTISLFFLHPERCGTGGGKGEDDLSSSERYFFSFKDRKYPSGTRTNRATSAGFWKATGRDKPVLSSRSNRGVIGMRKTLVFYKGRAPNGRKTDWIIHEYRLQTNEHAPTQVILHQAIFFHFLSYPSSSSSFENSTLTMTVMICRRKDGWCAARSRSLSPTRGTSSSLPMPQLLAATTTTGSCTSTDMDMAGIFGTCTLLLPERVVSPFPAMINFLRT
jgi:hypothetical protein